MSYTTTRTGIATALTLAGVFAAIMVATPAASAAPPREPEYSDATSSASAYAEPLGALGGRTLAQYLADLRSVDPRLD